MLPPSGNARTLIGRFQVVVWANAGGADSRIISARLFCQSWFKPSHRGICPRHREYQKASTSDLPNQHRSLSDKRNSVDMLPREKTNCLNGPDTRLMNRSCQLTGRSCLGRLPHDLVGAQTIGGQQHDPRAPHMFLGADPRQSSRRARSAPFTSTVIPVRILQTRMTATTRESSLDFRQILSTRPVCAEPSTYSSDDDPLKMP